MAPGHRPILSKHFSGFLISDKTPYPVPHKQVWCFSSFYCALMVTGKQVSSNKDKKTLFPFGSGI